MRRLIWSPRSLRDVQRLYRFLAPKNADAATRAVVAIRAGMKMLRSQPNMGRPSENMPVEFREWVVDFGSSGYVVLYRHDSDVELITVLAVRHQRELGY